MNKEKHPKKQRILIVDDHPLVCAGLAGLIADEPDLEVCGEAQTMQETLALVSKQSPNLAIIDLSLEEFNGLEIVRRLKLQYPEVKVLVCSMHEETMFAQRALEAGATGYINKHEATTCVISAIRQVLEGKFYLSKRMTERILLRVSRGNVAAPSDLCTLSDRELEVFDLIGQGHGTSQIAKQLNLSVKTIETHRDKIKRKLNLASSTQVVRRAVQWNLEKQ